jgi:hypothetical protein
MRGMRYGMRTLLILMAVVPPAAFVAFLLAQIVHPSLAIFPLAWCAAFVMAVTRKPQIETPIGLTPAELLVILAIVVVLAALMYDPMFWLRGVRY